MVEPPGVAVPSGQCRLVERGATLPWVQCSDRLEPLGATLPWVQCSERLEPLGVAWGALFRLADHVAKGRAGMR